MFSYQFWNLYTLQEENINRANNIPQLLELFYHSGGNLQIPELIREHLVDSASDCIIEQYNTL